MKSLSHKMFWMTFSSFLFLIGAVVLSFFIYFNNFYEPLKINKMITSINQFSEQYLAESWSENQLYDHVATFMKTHNATLSIFDSNGMTTNDISAGYIIVSPAATTTVSENVDATEPAAVTEIGASTIIYGTQIDLPVSTMIQAAEAMPFLEKSGVQYAITALPLTTFKQADFYKPIVLPNGQSVELYVNLSLQSVDEVLTSFNQFIPLLLVSALLISLIMAVIYSKTISKPIVHITQIANKMAAMDFEGTVTLQRKDELGELSTSLNTMSGNLNQALIDLKIANEQLRLDYENELRLEGARKEFVANVSHELRTPLGVVKGYTEGILDQIKEEKKTYYAQIILEEVQRMEQMVTDMLEISKLDSGAGKYILIPASLEPLMDKAFDSMIPSLHEKKLIIDKQGDWPFLLIDNAKMQRVCHNLVENAVKYSEVHQAIIVNSQVLEDACIVSIENVCPPLPEEALPKIWDRFYKADLSHNRGIRGTGLGLSIVKSILVELGATYGVENTETGVRFYCSFPLPNQQKD